MVLVVFILLGWACWIGVNKQKIEKEKGEVETDHGRIVI